MAHSNSEDEIEDFVKNMNAALQYKEQVRWDGPTDINHEDQD